MAKSYKDLAKKNEGKVDVAPSFGGGSVDFLKEKMQLQMKLGVTQKMLDKTLNEYRYLCEDMPVGFRGLNE